MVRPGRLSQAISPPASATSLATSARPSPCPPRLVVTKGSKRLARTSSGIPGPLSRTQTSSGR